MRRIGRWESFYARLNFSPAHYRHFCVFVALMLQNLILSTTSNIELLHVKKGLVTRIVKRSDERALEVWFKKEITKMSVKLKEEEGNRKLFLISLCFSYINETCQIAEMRPPQIKGPLLIFQTFFQLFKTILY